MVAKSKVRELIKFVLKPYYDNLKYCLSESV